MISIQSRAASRHTNAFVTPETIDLLAVKFIGLIGDRRMTKTHRYLTSTTNQPRVFTGLRLDRRGMCEPISHRRRQSVGVHLASQSRGIEGVSFGVSADNDVEEKVARRYHHPEEHWLNRREDITAVEMTGSPGEPARDDSIRIEYWNSNGVGQETIIVFDDIDLLEEIAWDINGDKERQVYMWDEFCTVHHMHYEHHLHDRSAACQGRPPTRGETLAALAANALRNEAKQA